MAMEMSQAAIKLEQKVAPDLETRN